MGGLSDYLNSLKGKPLNAVGTVVNPGLAALAALGNNPTAKDFLAKLGFGKSQAQKDAESNLEASKQNYASLNPPSLTPEKAALTQAGQVGPINEAQAFDEGKSAYNNIAVDPAYKQAQLEQLGALKNLAANGGKNAASEANLAQIQQAENQNAKGQRDAILQNAQARGMGGSGASLLAQLSSSQNATNNQSAQDLGVAGQQANTAMQAGMGAANIGSNLENTDYGQQANAAAANDAIARFNAGQRTGTSQYNAGAGNQAAMYNAGQQTAANQFNANAQNAAQQYNSGLQQTQYQNQFQKTAGLAGSNLAGVNYNQAQANMGAQQAGNILSSGVKVGTAVAGAPAAHGGRIPGVAPVSGDSSLNDFVPIKASPGEVVVPRSLAKGGSSHDIASFVQHPPKVQKPSVNPSQDREAMLSALKNIKNRRAF